MKLRALALLLLTVLGLGALSAHAAAPASLRVQVFDQNGAPVRDAVVEVRTAARAGAAGGPWRRAVAQKNQPIVPGVLIVPKGATVAFPNLDQVRHSIYSFSKPARFQIDLYGRDQSRMQTFPITGTVALGCNIHDWMRGYIRVVDTPFAAKTDGNGIATVSGMPSGAARIVIWHPALRTPSNEMALDVQLAAGTNDRKVAVSVR
ncbi:MAG: methylamine utilization protein [Tsuneonella sp.]